MTPQSCAISVTVSPGLVLINRSRTASRRQAAGGRRQAAGGRRQAAGGEELLWRRSAVSPEAKLQRSRAGAEFARKRHDRHVVLQAVAQHRLGAPDQG
jgi:hypothetical protein